MEVSGAALLPPASTVNTEITVFCRCNLGFLLSVALLGVDLLSRVVNLFNFEAASQVSKGSLVLLPARDARSSSSV